MEQPRFTRRITPTISLLCLTFVGAGNALALLCLAGYAPAQTTAAPRADPLKIAETFLRSAYPEMWSEATRVSASTDDWVGYTPAWRSGQYTVRVERTPRPGGVFGGIGSTSTPCLEPDEVKLLGKQPLAGPLPFVNGCEIPLRSSSDVLWEGLFYFSVSRPPVVQGTLSRIRHENFALAQRANGNPDWSDSQTIQALKEAGAQYGPLEKQAFVSRLTLSKYAPFLIARDLESVEFGLPSDNARHLEWPRTRLLWTVECLGPREGAAQLACRLEFEPFGRTLVSFACGPRPVRR